MVAKAVCRWCRRTALVVVAVEPVAGCSGRVRLVALGVRWLLVGESSDDSLVRVQVTILIRSLAILP